MSDITTRRKAISEAMIDVAQFAKSDLLRPFVTLLDALAEEALADLATITPDNLQRKQGVLAQLHALRSALLTSGQVSPVAA